MMEKLSLLNFRQKITLFLIFLSLLLIPLALFAIEQRTKYRGRAYEGEDPRTLVPSTVYIPYFPVGKAEKVDDNELDTSWRNTIEVFNLAGEENSIEVTFFDQSGQSQATISANLSPHATASLSLPGDQKCWQEGCLYSAVIKSSYAVSAIANLVREAANQYSVTSYKGTLTPFELQHVAYFPAILRQLGTNQEDRIETELFFFNPNETEVELNGDIFDSYGAWNIPAASFSTTLKPKSSYRINTKDLNLPFPFAGSAIINQAQPLASLALLYSDKRLYSYTPAFDSTSLFIPAVNNKIFYYPFGFKKTIVIQSHASGTQEVTVKFVHEDFSSSEIKFEIDPNLSYFLDMTGRLDEEEEVGISLLASSPISALMIKETPTYWGDVVLAKPRSFDSLYFPFIANRGSDIPTETYISMFNPHEGPLNLTFASFDENGLPIRKRDDDGPITIWALRNKTLPTSDYLFTPDNQAFSQGSLSVYSELEGKGFLAVVEGVRRLSDSRALLAGDAFFSYDGQPLFAAQIPSPTLTSKPTPTPKILCPPECESGLPRRMGNAVCDDQINEEDFNLWLSQYKIYQAGEIIAPGKREADFYCDPNNPSTQVVNLADFEFFRRNAFGGVIPTPAPPCPNPDYCFDPSFCPLENQHPEFGCEQENLVCCLYLTPTPKVTASPTLTPTPTPTITTSAFFFLSPSRGYHQKEETFEVFVNIDTGGQETTSADAVLLFDESILEVEEISAGNFYPQNFKEMFPGKLYIGGAVEGPKETRSGSGVLGEITFRGKNEGSVSVRFDCTPGRTDDSNIVAADSGATDILDCSKIINGTYIISEPVSTPTPAFSPTPTLISGCPRPYRCVPLRYCRNPVPNTSCPRQDYVCCLPFP